MRYIVHEIFFILNTALLRLTSKIVRRKCAHFDAIFTLKNTGRASMDGARHDFAKSAVCPEQNPNFFQKKSGR